MEPSSSAWTLDTVLGSSLIHRGHFHGKYGRVATKHSGVARWHMCCRCTPICNCCHAEMPHALRLRALGKPNPFREDRRQRRATASLDVVTSPHLVTSSAAAVGLLQTSPRFKKQKAQLNFNRLNGDAHLGEASHPGPTGIRLVQLQTDRLDRQTDR